MAWLPSAQPNATEGKMIRTPTGNAVFLNGAFYVLKAPCTAVANTVTETSLFTGDNSTTTPIIVQMGSAPFYQYPGSTRILPPGSLTEGSMFNMDFYGSIANTGTPNLQLRLSLTNAAGTVAAIADSTAVAMTTTSGTVFFHVMAGFNVQAASKTAGIINGWCGYEYLAVGTQSVAPVLKTTAFDTTAQYTIDLLATWGTASASNTCVINYGAIEIIG